MSSESDPPRLETEWGPPGLETPTLHPGMARLAAVTAFCLAVVIGAFCETPLHSAARFGREDLADLLLSYGADPRGAE